jgi:hypothetical protein
MPDVRDWEELESLWRGIEAQESRGLRLRCTNLHLHDFVEKVSKYQPPAALAS